VDSEKDDFVTRKNGTYLLHKNYFQQGVLTKTGGGKGVDQEREGGIAGNLCSHGIAN